MKAPVTGWYDLKGALKVVSVSHCLEVPKTPDYDTDVSSYLVGFLSGATQQVKSVGEPEGREDGTDKNVDLERVYSIQGDILAHLDIFLLNKV